MTRNQCKNYNKPHFNSNSIQKLFWSFNTDLLLGLHQHEIGLPVNTQSKLVNRNASGLSKGAVLPV